MLNTPPTGAQLYARFTAALMVQGVTPPGWHQLTTAERTAWDVLSHQESTRTRAVRAAANDVVKVAMADRGEYRCGFRNDFIPRGFIDALASTLAP